MTGSDAGRRIGRVDDRLEIQDLAVSYRIVLDDGAFFEAGRRG